MHEELKQGDKVWFFNGKEVSSMTVEVVKADAIYGYNKVQTKDCGEIGRFAYRIEMPFPIFRTRKSLREYYRKFFE